jgi:hypothetical protein
MPTEEKSGELTPLVLIPRYTTYCGVNSFVTVALDVGLYSGMTIAFWNGPVVGSVTLNARIQSSDDGETWFDEGSPIAAGLPDSFGKQSIALGRRWIRIRVTLAGTPGAEAAVTCWATGSLEKRLP